MRISNLYIGDISVVQQLKNEPLSGTPTAFLIKKTAHYKIKRCAVLMKKNINDKEAKDIIYGGKYQIKKPTDCKVGEEFVSNLDQFKLLNAIQEAGYTKSIISKRKLLKIVMSKNLLNNMN